ncbi:MAG: twin-arginine translocase subunit TatC, partial [Steroidobacteraceae bacterium]|nr:twin-arginine translocase subunit TatC [Steroidobacteraceae bacterium]
MNDTERDPRDEEQLAEGTLMSHLLELRDRLLRAMLAVLIAMIPCLIFANELFTFAAQPLLQKLPQGASLIATSVIAP